MWDIIDEFDAFNLSSIPRNHNKKVDKLAAMGVEFNIPSEVNSANVQNYVKVVVRPSIPNSNVCWQFFDNDEKIINFLIEEVEFSVGNQRKL